MSAAAPSLQTRRPGRQSGRKAFLWVTAAGILASCGQAPPRTADPSDRPVKIAVLEYVQPGDQLFEIVNRGALDAGRALKADINVQYAAMDPLMMNTLIDTAIARKVDGIAITIDNDNAYRAALCRAQRAGITVVAFNVDATDRVRGCRAAFVGQDLEQAGFTLGQALLASARLKRGDTVFTPVEFPEASYAILRHRGVARALAAAGVRTELVGTGNTPPQVLDRMQQYLIGHPDTKAMVTLGSVTGRMAVRAADGAGRKSLPIATFDNSAEISAGILGGRIIATADQQPYAQGFQSVAAIVLASRFGIVPSDVATGSKKLTDRPSMARTGDMSRLLGVYR